MDVDATMFTIDKVKAFINSKWPGRPIPLDLYWEDEGPLDDDLTLHHYGIPAGDTLFAYRQPGGDGTIVNFVSERGGSSAEVDRTDSIEAILLMAKQAGIPMKHQRILIVDKRMKGGDFFADEAMSI